MGLSAREGSFSDHETDITGAVGVHFLIKGYRFAFAIGGWCNFDFARCFPFRAEGVGDSAQVLNPVVYECDRDALLFDRVRRGEDWLDTGHLPVIGGGSDAEQDGLGEAGENGEKEEAKGEEEDLPRFEGLDTYKNHSNYDSYKHRPCQ